MIKWVALLLFVGFVGNAAAETRDVSRFFNDNFGDLRNELQTAKTQGKKGILLMYEMDECPFCHRMKATVLNQSEVQDFFQKHFLVFSIDTKGDTSLTDFDGKETTPKAFSEKNRARATPVFAFYDLEGKEITRFTGASKDAAEFLLLGRYVVDGAYQTKGMTFSKYKLQQAKK